MSQSNYSLVLREVSQIDIKEISATVPPTDLTVVEPTDSDETHGELATILILTLTPMAVTAFTVWLMKDTTRETLEYKVTIRSPDGSEKDVSLKIERKSSTAPDAQVIAQITKALSLPEGTISSVSS
jgi:hypothetical protein